MESDNVRAGEWMGELRPLDEGLNPECRDFAEALRSLFAGLEVSVRRYAARRFRDAGTISRYLSGTRIPPWEFVLDLFSDVAEHMGVPATSATIQVVRDLHRTAMRTNASLPHAVEMLQIQLADADREARRSSVQEDALGEALLDRTHRIAQLEVRLNQLEARWTAGPHEAAACVEVHLGDRDTLLMERDMLAAEVRRLTEELEEARRRGMLAEARCDLLERQLAAVEEQDVLPLQDAAGMPVAPTSDTPAFSDCVPKVLLVDDQMSNLLALENAITTPGHVIVCASSGQEALKALLDDDDFAVIILDVQMPGMDGYETAAHIKRRARTRTIPIIFLTAMGSDPEHSIRGYSAGAVDYIVKPFDPWALRAKVGVFVDIYLERRHYRQLG